MMLAFKESHSLAMHYCRLVWDVRSLSKVIKGKLSDTKFKRDFLAQATNPESVDFIFKNTYIKVNRIFEEKLVGKYS